MTERQTVYIEFDDAAGQNHIRRPLPHVDLQKLAPGATTTFTDQFLATGLRPGRYFVWLWIPSVDVVHKFDVQYNFLLGNSGMADSTNGLNRITGEDRLTDRLLCDFRRAARRRTWLTCTTCEQCERGTHNERWECVP